MQFTSDNGFSIHVGGAITKADAQSCLPGADDCAPATAVRFAWGLAAGTSFDDRAPEEGDAGFVVPSGGTAQLKRTIHGDHWFFTDISQDAEARASVRRVRRCESIAQGRDRGRGPAEQ